MEGRLRCVNATPHPRTPEMNAPGANPFSPNPGVHYLDEPEPVFPPRRRPATATGSRPNVIGPTRPLRRSSTRRTRPCEISLILGEEKVDVLLLSKRDGLDDVQAEGAHLNSVLERYAPFVRVGGMIVLDSYLSSPGVARVLERDGEYQMVKTGLSVRSRQTQSGAGAHQTMANTRRCARPRVTTAASTAPAQSPIGRRRSAGPARPRRSTAAANRGERASSPSTTRPLS